MDGLMGNLKAFAREVWIFLTSVLFLKNFAAMIGLIVGVAFLTNWWLGCYTNHGESVEVDDFTRMNLSDAEKQGSDKDFEFEVLDSIYTDGQPSGIILNQTPKPFSRVKEGRKIYVTITGDPTPFRLPNLKESSYDFDQYAKRLALHSVKSRVKERAYDKRQAENTILYFYHNGKKVMESDVKSGYFVLPGDMLEFVVTERLSNELEIPDLVCMNYTAAEFLISSSNLNLGEVNDDGAVTDKSTAFVYKQDPAPGGIIQMGGQITVWITQTLPIECSGAQEDDADDSDTGQ